VSEQFIFRTRAYCKVSEIAEAQNFVLFRKIIALKKSTEEHITYVWARDLYPGSSLAVFWSRSRLHDSCFADRVL